MANRPLRPKGERLSVSSSVDRPIRITIHTLARIGSRASRTDARIVLRPALGWVMIPNIHLYPSGSGPRP